MGRRNRRRKEPARATPGAVAAERREDTADGMWVVRTLSGAASTKTYRCPGCSHEISPGAAHLVTWPADGVGGFGGPDDRRHWHATCWRARDRRGPTSRRRDAAGI